MEWKGREQNGIERKREKRLYNAPENQRIFPDTQPAIIDENIWEWVQELLQTNAAHAPDKSSGHRRQRIQLVWNFIGEVNLPNDEQTIERQRKSRTA